MELDTAKNSSSRPVLTAGIVFRDGTSISLLSRGRLLLSSGEGELIDKLTAKAARTLIRSFGFRPFRNHDDQLKLDAAAAAMVHQLASERQARSMIAPTANCRLCKKLALTTSPTVVEEY